MTLLILILTVIVFVGLLIALRGFRSGSDPHCRKCGFNLRGKPDDSMRCPECGTELSAKTIRIGERKRVRTMVVIAVVGFAVCAAGLSLQLYRDYRDYDWTPWKPTTWLLQDVDAGIAGPRDVAVRELTRRLETPEITGRNILQIVDHALLRQGDRSGTFRWDPAWAELIEKAILLKKLDAQRIETYVRQGAATDLVVKPKLRRGQTIQLDLTVRYDRFTDDTRRRAGWETSALTIGDKEILKADWADNKAMHEVGGSSGYFVGFDGDSWSTEGVPDGKHELRGKVLLNLAIEEPFKVDPIAVELPIAAPVELVPSDATVDEFVTDAAQREAMRASIKTVRVRKDDEGFFAVELKTEQLPIALAMEAVLVQGQAEQRIGVFRQEANEKAKWTKAMTRAKPKLTGTVDVHLRPDQRAADSTRKLGTYWGEPIVIEDVVIDAPYVPAFAPPEPMRGAVEAAIKGVRLDRDKKTVSVYLNIDRAPTKLSFVVFVETPEKTVRVPGHYSVDKDSGYSYGRSVPGIDPNATRANIILKPNPSWETDTSGSDPPWGGEIVYRDIPIEPRAK